MTLRIVTRSTPTCCSSSAALTTAHPDGEALLWHYPATVLRVIDGDTLDARVDLGFATTLDERFRLADINAPEIFGVPAGSPERERGLAARAFLEERLAASNGRVNLTSERRGKWRRWIAMVCVPGQAMSLNYQLVRAGLADLMRNRSRPVRPPAGFTLHFDADLRTRLQERSAQLGVDPAAVIRTALTEYLDR